MGEGLANDCFFLPFIAKNAGVHKIDLAIYKK